LPNPRLKVFGVAALTGAGATGVVAVDGVIERFLRNSANEGFAGFGAWAGVEVVAAGVVGAGAVAAGAVGAGVTGAAGGVTAGTDAWVDFGVTTVRVETRVGTVAAGLAPVADAPEFLLDALPGESVAEPAPPRPECVPRSDEVCVPESACATEGAVTAIPSAAENIPAISHAYGPTSRRRCFSATSTPPRVPSSAPWQLAIAQT
jgi:hypothetical protein